MELPATPLSDQLASLRTTLTAAEAPRWMPDRVHALIIACLARIFARLEHVLTLWQAGQLPAPPHPASTPQRAQNPRMPSPRMPSPRMPSPRQTTPYRATLSPSTPATAPSVTRPDRQRKPAHAVPRAAPAPGMIATIASAFGGRVAPSHHFARAPPWGGAHQPRTPPKRGWRSHIQFISL